MKVLSHEQPAATTDVQLNSKRELSAQLIQSSMINMFLLEVGKGNGMTLTLNDGLVQDFLQAQPDPSYENKVCCLSWRLAPVNVSREIRRIVLCKENNESQIMFKKKNTR
jgi:hypothetical protein